MAAEILSQSGRRVLVVEAMPTPARKFLMAGKSGLNLTKDEPFGAFARRFAVGTGALPRTPGYLGQKRKGGRRTGPPFAAPGSGRMTQSRRYSRWLSMNHRSLSAC